MEPPAQSSSANVVGELVHVDNQLIGTGRFCCVCWKIKRSPETETHHQLGAGLAGDICVRLVCVFVFVYCVVANVTVNRNTHEKMEENKDWKEIMAGLTDCW